MRKQVKRWVAVVLCLCICCNCTISLHAAGTVMPVTFSQENLRVAKTGSEQTITMRVLLEETLTLQNFSYMVTCPNNIQLDSAVIGTTQLEIGNSSNTYTITKPVDGSIHTNYLCDLTFTISSGIGLGSYTIDLFGDREADNGIVVGGNTYSVSAQTTIHVVASDSYVASLSGSSSARVGDTVEMKVTVSGGDFASAAFVLTYDADLLEFKTADGANYSAQNGKVTVTDFGATKTAPHDYHLTFLAKAEGDAAVTLTEAAFGTANSAETGDLTAAALSATDVTVNVSAQQFDVALPSIFEGNDTAENGKTYTFTAKDIANYTYGAVTATMSGQTFTVEPDENGVYTIANVTGVLVIRGERTPNRYDVTFQTSTNVNLPADGEATYGEDYSFTMPTEANYTVSIESIRCKGQAVDYTISGKTVTIDGADILGDIVITLKKVRANADVAISGNGAGELTADSDVAVPGTDYTVTLTADPRYSYAVTATVNGVAVTLTKDGHEYTINGSDVQLGDIVFTVEKTLLTNLIKLEYLTFNGTAVWLVQNKVTKMNNTIYTYDGEDMLWSDKYNAYCCLVIAQTSEAITVDKLSFRDGTTASVEYDMDVNGSGKVDMNDAQLTYNLYNNVYQNFTNTVTMEKMLEADVNGDGMVDTEDAAAIVNFILGKS